MTRVLDARTSIESMRDAGYKNEAYAIAELMDNSIQAEASIVELITFSNANESGGQRIEKIAVFDNGTGMEPKLLQRSLSFGQGDNRLDEQGMGKFGFGLPSASISQCKHVDVWSWTKEGEAYTTYIDVDDMLAGNGEEVSRPVKKSLPEYITRAIGDILPPSGTVILWSKIDRAKWKTATALSKHVEHEIGRMYRRFIAREENPVTIRFKPYQKNGTVYVLKNASKNYRASDPLALLRNTAMPTLPGDFCDESLFEIGEERTIRIKDENGKKHEVILTWSIGKQVIIDAILESEREKGSEKTAGATEWGVYLKRNQGLSIVRAKRELILRDRMLSREEKWRFIGMEIVFPPALDKVFGVLNNKQDAVHIDLLDKSDDAINEGFENPCKYIKSLDPNDRMRGLYDISDVLKDFKTDAAEALKKLKIQVSNPPTPINPDGPIPMPTGPIEPGDPIPDPLPNHDELVKSLTDQGISEDVALVVARKVEKEKIRYWVQEADLSTDAFFDVTHAKGITLILININHIFYQKVLSNCQPSQKLLIELAIGSYGYMEHSSRDNEMLKAQYQRTRRNWGVYLENVLQAQIEE